MNFAAFLIVVVVVVVVVVVHVQTAASDILGYPYVEISSAKSTLNKCTVFFNILVLILESCTTSGVYLKQCQNIYDEPFSLCIFVEKFHHRYLARV